MTENVEVHAPRGRGRPRSSRAQEAIRAAAARLFAEQGYTGASVRDIAAAAGVDPAVVIRHFGSKEALFLQTMSVDEGFRGIIDGPLEDLGTRLLQRLTSGDTAERARVYAALMGALDRTDVRDYLRASAERHIIGPLTTRMTGPDVRERAELVAAQVTGLLTLLWVMRDGGDRAATDLLVAKYAPALQLLIDG